MNDDRTTGSDGDMPDEEGLTDKERALLARAMKSPTVLRTPRRADENGS